MEDKRCFKPGCMLDIEYSCPCSSPPSYSCKLHALNHIEIPNKEHVLKSIFVEPGEETREAVLKFLAKMDSKHKKLKKKLLATFSQRFFETENDLGKLMAEFDSYSAELNNCFRKISETKRISKSEQDPILSLLSLQPNEAVEKLKTIIPPNSDWQISSRVLCGFSEKIEKMIECFIENKFQHYLYNRLTKIESTLEKHNASISIATNELANVKDSISSLINENSKSWKHFEEWKESIKLKTDNELNLLNSRINSITEDINSTFKELEIAQKNVTKIMTLQDLRDKRSKMLNRSMNPELEEEFRMACSAYESDPSDRNTSVAQAYQEYINTYHQKTSLFNVIRKDNRTNLLIYNTETGIQESKILETSEPLHSRTCITQLPNGKLFCYGNDEPISGIKLIIDENYRVEELPSGTKCRVSSAIYFNNNIYCFGGSNNSNLTLSMRFDLNRNQWIELTPLPQKDGACNSIIFNGSILISGYYNKNLLRYSIDNNSFTTIPYDFAAVKRKILINAERLYLIECENGSMYESEIGSDTTWRRINNSIIDFHPRQTYCQYNKGGIYIGCAGDERYSCFKFNLNEKSLIKLV